MLLHVLCATPPHVRAEVSLLHKLCHPYTIFIPSFELLHSAMLCYALCNALSAGLCFALLCYALLCYSLLCCAIRYYAMLCSTLFNNALSAGLCFALPC